MPPAGRRQARVPCEPAEALGLRRCPMNPSRDVHSADTTGKRSRADGSARSGPMDVTCPHAYQRFWRAIAGSRSERRISRNRPRGGDDVTPLCRPIELLPMNRNPGLLADAVHGAIGRPRLHRTEGNHVLGGETRSGWASWSAGPRGPPQEATGTGRVRDPPS